MKTVLSSDFIWFLEISPSEVFDFEAKNTSNSATTTLKVTPVLNTYDGFMNTEPDASLSPQKSIGCSTARTAVPDCIYQLPYTGITALVR